MVTMSCDEGLVLPFVLLPSAVLGSVNREGVRRALEDLRVFRPGMVMTSSGDLEQAT